MSTTIDPATVRGAVLVLPLEAAEVSHPVLSIEFFLVLKSAYIERTIVKIRLERLFSDE